MAGVRKPRVLAVVDLSPGEGREREDPDVIKVVGRAVAATIHITEIADISLMEIGVMEEDNPYML